MEGRIGQGLRGQLVNEVKDFGIVQSATSPSEGSRGLITCGRIDRRHRRSAKLLGCGAKVPVSNACCGAMPQGITLGGYPFVKVGLVEVLGLRDEGCSLFGLYRSVSEAINIRYSKLLLRLAIIVDRCSSIEINR